VVLEKDGEVLHRVKEKRNILQTIKRRTGHMLHKNYLLKHVIEGEIGGWIEVTGRRRRRHKQLRDDLQEMRGY
jgi:hypothetical protein